MSLRSRFWNRKRVWVECKYSDQQQSRDVVDPVFEKQEDRDEKEGVENAARDLERREIAIAQGVDGCQDQREAP